MGPSYQTVVTSLLQDRESDGRELADTEELVYCPENDLTDRQIDQFMVLARSVGTFGRALDCTSSIRLPSLHMSAAAASRDITLVCAPCPSCLTRRCLVATR